MKKNNKLTNVEQEQFKKAQEVFEKIKQTHGLIFLVQQDTEYSDRRCVTLAHEISEADVFTALCHFFRACARFDQLTGLKFLMLLTEFARAPETWKNPDPDPISKKVDDILKDITDQFRT